MKYKVGDRVILLSKFGEKNFKYSSVVYRTMLKKNQPYGYISAIRKDNTLLVNDKPNVMSGDYYIESDLKPYIQEERKLKLKKLKWKINHDEI